MLGTRSEDEIVFLLPRRFRPNVGDFVPIPIDLARAAPMIHATAGQSGLTRAPDYRGVQVIAAFRPIRYTNWGVVVKQDEEEALAAVGKLRSSLVMGVSLLLLVSIVVIGPMVRMFVRPLRELETATRQVAAGDLSTELPVAHMDEVGQLAAAFNKMVGHLRLAREELSKRNEELASFAYVVSHDLKTPLRGISTLSEWLEADLGDRLEPEEKEHVRLLRERVQRMDALINDLLEYSRLGRHRSTNISVDLNHLITRVIESVAAPDNFRIDVTERMPTLVIDDLRLSQVFQNLIDNAVKHHPGPEANIEVGCRDGDTHWEFSVRDDGDGIEARHQERIFQMFQTLSAEKSADSTGIGLALVRKIVEEFGGKVWVESDGQPGKGAAFLFTIPKQENKA